MRSLAQLSQLSALRGTRVCLGWWLCTAQDTLDSLRADVEHYDAERVAMPNRPLRRLYVPGLALALLRILIEYAGPTLGGFGMADTLSSDVPRRRRRPRAPAPSASKSWRAGESHLFVCGARWHWVCEGTARAPRVAVVRREAAEAEAASAAEEAQRAGERARATVSA
eukprot:COSAG01_NODE_18571_length_1067_cov_0.872934_2_plen_168_part_00